MKKRPSSAKRKKINKNKKNKDGKNVYAGVGIRKANDAYKAGKEAVKMAIEKSGKPPEFGVVFCSGAKYGKDDATIKKLVKGADDEFKRNKNYRPQTFCLGQLYRG